MAEVGAGAGVAVGVGDLLWVEDEPEVELVGADLFGIVPEVEAVGEEGGVLGVDEAEDDEGFAALVEVLAYGHFTLGSGTVSSGLDLTLSCAGGAWSRINSAMPSAVVTV